MAVDQATIKAAQMGRREAMAELLRSLQDPWFRLAVTLLGSREEARDATQEAALRFVRDLPHFGGQSQLRTWAIGLALNVIREHRRKRPMTFLAEMEGQSPLPGPAVQVELAEQLQVLRSLLEELPDRQREALILRYFEDLPVQEAATVMNCATGTIKATVHQALRALRRRMTTRQ
ncbi:MAG TPA: sigma-70 family RNA polymerase sigma factor [Tepidisphaeraceae bacterium]|nr:sigma-70 family RNA polymerase sigma factor [Tepidisphaeraceae bacterium]